MSRVSPEISLPFVVLDRTSRTPLYMQLYAGIKSAILSGLLKEGERMPATRILAADLEVSRNCVLLAFEQLVLEGYLSGKTGAGTFVSTEIPLRSPRKESLMPSVSASRSHLKEIGTVDYPLSDEILIKDSQLEAIKPFQTSVPAFDDFPFATWARLAAGVYRNIQSLHLGYDDAQGYLPLREALSQYLRVNRSINCTAEQIVMVNGSRQGLHLAAELLLKKGDLCWMEDPGYNTAKVAFTRNGGKLCPVPVTSEGLDIDYAISHYPAAKFAYVTPSHQYPMGGTMPLAQRLKLLQWASDKKMWIIEDDYDSEFRYNGRPIPALQGLDNAGNVIYIGTFSKVLFPALRMGYVVLPSAQVAQQFKFVKSIADRQNALIDQAILTQFINGGHFNRHLKRMRTLYKKQQDQLVTLIMRHLGDDVEVIAGDAGMHLILLLKNQIRADRVVSEALKKGVIVHAVNDFAVKFRQTQALLVGFTGFKKRDVEKAAMALKTAIK